MSRSITKWIALLPVVALLGACCWRGSPIIEADNLEWSWDPEASKIGLSFEGTPRMWALAQQDKGMPLQARLTSGTNSAGLNQLGGRIESVSAVEGRPQEERVRYQLRFRCHPTTRIQSGEDVEVLKSLLAAERPTLLFIEVVYPFACSVGYHRLDPERFRSEIERLKVPLVALDEHAGWRWIK